MVEEVREISVGQLAIMAERMFGDLVKGVVDIERDALVVDVDMHADAEQYLLESGSAQVDLWGINLYPQRFATDGFIEFDSLINIRPRQHNPSRDILDEQLRQRIRRVVAAKVLE